MEFVRRDDEIVPNYAGFTITRWNRVVTGGVILLTGAGR